MDRPRILVVEDEFLIREVMVRMLTEAGFSVDEAATADEAVPLLDADGYKLLLTDVQMPGTMDGIALAERTHIKKPGLPIIFVTAQADVLSQVRAAGLDGTTLSKPYDPEDVVKIVRSLLRT